MTVRRRFDSYPGSRRTEFRRHHDANGALVSDARPAAVIVLAGGEGRRMKSATPKVLHTMCGRTLLGHVLDAIEPLQPERLLVVLGHERPAVEKFLAEVAPQAQVVVQDQPLGTGNAARLAVESVPDLTGT